VRDFTVGKGGKTAVKSVISGLFVAFSMYSAIPVPQVNWEKQTMRWALGFLPLIGVLIGAIEWFWFAFCMHFGAAGVFYAVIAALIPLAVSGGIHLDGLCDTCDALCSFGDREKRLDILKDPHVGAFGPLWLMAFLLAEVGCFAQIYDRPVLLPLACTGFAFARTMGGRKVVAAPCAKDSGLAHIFAENSDKRAVSRMLLAEFVLFAVLLGLWACRVPHALAAAKVLVIVLVVWYAVHEHISRRVFGGVTGDLAGFCISLSELITLAAAAIGGLIL
jgi:adenosylcobinamide-GDP ribazoletransferase